MNWTSVFAMLRLPAELVGEIAHTVEDAVNGAITGAAVGWLERRGFTVTPPADHVLGERSVMASPAKA